MSAEENTPKISQSMEDEIRSDLKEMGTSLETARKNKEQTRLLERRVELINEQMALIELNTKAQIMKVGKGIEPEMDVQYRTTLANNKNYQAYLTSKRESSDKIFALSLDNEGILNTLRLNEVRLRLLVDAKKTEG